MKYINIISLVQAYDSLGCERFDGFLRFYGIEIKGAEFDDLKSLKEALYALTDSISIFDAFYVGYKIPQIGKEFDLLRFGKKIIINVELKRTCTEDKIKKQLLRNKYYLGGIGRKVYNFTFVSDVDVLYFLSDDECLESVDLLFLEELLKSQEVNYAEVVDDLFDPSDYLVSPFNATRKFMNDEYFLTHQQEEVKNKIIQSLGRVKAASFISVVGSAGTGKTLLVYDIAKQLREAKKNTLIVHCGYLNDGQEELNRNGWKIIPIKNYARVDLSNYDLVIVDEAQRIYPNQFDDFIQKINAVNGCCLFSYDKLQTLSRTEEIRDIDSKVNSIRGLVTHKLSEKIRTNKEIAEFIKMLFNNKRNLVLSAVGNIELNYFKSLEDAKEYLGLLDACGWEILRFTPSQYRNEHHEQYSETSRRTSHQVIGQEFDGVAVTIDKFFSYNDSGELYYRGDTYYHSAKMLFQNITRARKKLNIVIIDNEELLGRCVSILQ